MTDQLAMTTEPVSTEAAEAFDHAMVAVRATLHGEILVSQDRCVDELLDLYNAAPNEVLRSLVADIVGEIRHLTAVRAATILSQLGEVSAALAVEMAFAPGIR